MQFFFMPVLGVIADRVGRRPVILLSNLGLGLDYLVMALAPTLGWRFVGRIMSGITSGEHHDRDSLYSWLVSPAPLASRVAAAERDPVHRIHRA
jgi:MFS transporter, DHA1 family, tetracycline resistance protein